MIKPTAHIKDWDLGRCSLAILGQHIPEFSEGHFLFAIKKVALDNVLMRKVWFMLCERQVLEFQIVPAIDLCDFFLTEKRLSEIRRDVYGGNIRFQCKVVMRERSKTVIEVVSSPWIHQVSNLCAESCLTIWL